MFLYRDRRRRLRKSVVTTYKSDSCCGVTSGRRTPPQASCAPQVTPRSAARRECRRRRRCSLDPSYANSRWAALPVLMAGTFMIVMGFFIVNVAFPSIQADLHASGSAIEWVVAGYGLTYASFLIAAGRIGDHIGRRRLLAIGLLLFVLSSVACGVAPGPASLVAARLVQGLAAAMISPSVLSILGVIYTGQDRVRAISVYGMTLGLAAVGGQLIGGILIHWDVGGLGWRLIFLINVPVGIAALSLIRRLVPGCRAA